MSLELGLQWWFNSVRRQRGLSSWALLSFLAEDAILVSWSPYNKKHRLDGIRSWDFSYSLGGGKFKMKLLLVHLRPLCVTGLPSLLWVPLVGSLCLWSVFSALHTQTTVLFHWSWPPRASSTLITFLIIHSPVIFGGHMRTSTYKSWRDIIQSLTGSY